MPRVAKIQWELRPRSIFELEFDYKEQQEQRHERHLLVRRCVLILPQSRKMHIMLHACTDLKLLIMRTTLLLCDLLVGLILYEMLKGICPETDLILFGLLIPEHGGVFRRS